MKKSASVTLIMAFSLLPLMNSSAFSQGNHKHHRHNKEMAKIVNVDITSKGFEPSSITVKSGDNVTLNLTRKTDTTCAKEVTVPNLKIKKGLPLNQTVSVELGKLDKGEIKFGCGMGMMLSAVIIAE